MSEKKILVFESGTHNTGGDFSEKLVRAFNNNDKTFYKGTIVGIVSDIYSGNVNKIAYRLGIPFYFLQGPWTAEAYTDIVIESEADLFVFVDWNRVIRGLGSNNSIKIHLGPFPQCAQYGAIGFYGRDTSEYVLRKFKLGMIQDSAIVAHFVTEEFMGTSIFSKIEVPLFKDDTIFSYEKRINETALSSLNLIVNKIVNKEIVWDPVNQGIINK